MATNHSLQDKFNRVGEEPGARVAFRVLQSTRANIKRDVRVQRLILKRGKGFNKSPDRAAAAAAAASKQGPILPGGVKAFD